MLLALLLEPLEGEGLVGLDNGLVGLGNVAMVAIWLYGYMIFTRSLMG